MPPKRKNSKRGAASTSSSDDAAAAAPAPAPPPILPTNPIGTSGTSVSSDTDTTPWSLVAAGSPHSRRDPTLSTLGRSTSPENTSTTTTDHHTDVDSNIIIPPTDDNNIPSTSTPPGGSSLSNVDGGGEVSTEGIAVSTEGMASATTRTAPSLESLFAELDILRNQASNFQTQLDQHRTIMATSVSSIQSELQTLRDASSSQYKMTNQAMDLAKQSYDTVLECKSDTSKLTLQFHNVTTTVERFIEKYQAPSAANDSPPTSSVEDAFQAADAALSEGISAMEREIGSHLDRNINVRLDPSSSDTRAADRPAGVRFQGVTYRPSSEQPYDSEAAFAAAHPDLASNSSDASSPAMARSTTTLRHGAGDGDGGNGGSPNAFGDGLSPRYNGPNSPRHRNALMRGCTPEILLWHAGGSLGDPVCGCPFMEAEDVEALDISSSLAVGIAEDHFGIVEGWDNPRWSQKDVRDFGGFEGGYQAPSAGGPHMASILKQISSWDKLSDLSPTGWQAFYNRLRRFCFKWNVALMPFEAINLKYECHGHALCTCGLGLARWKRMGDALFLILEYLLPTTNPVISTNLDSLANAPSAANGYELLWILLKEFIPMFDRSKPAVFPVWSDSSDIFQFARLLLMYCTLSNHRGPPYSEAMKSRMFLSNVRGRYASLAAQYSAMVGTYCPGRDGVIRCSDPLPNHLTVMELARTFYDETTNATASPSVPLPSIQAFHTSSTSSPPSLQLTNAVSSITTDTQHEHPPLQQPPTTRPSHIQGFSVNAVTRSQSNQRRRLAPDPTLRERRVSQYPKHEAPCEACGKYGHPASRCDMLGMAIWLLRYFKDKSNSETMQAVETRWVERNKKFLPRDDRSPRTILANYCAEMEFSEDKVDSELDWDFLSTAVDEDHVDE